MRNVLAISSATKKAYLSLKTDEFEDFCEIDANCKQSENILFEIDKLLTSHNMDIRSITDIAVVIGPGSFTGVRIGVALVKGLCAGNKEIKVYPLSSLDFMAEEVEMAENGFVCAINALSGLAFVKEFDKYGKAISEEKMINASELSAYNSQVYGLEEENMCENKISLSSAKLLTLALKRIEAGVSVKPSELSPVYLRNSQAEENLNKNKKSD